MALVDNLISYYNFEKNTDDIFGTNNGSSTLLSWGKNLTDINAKFNDSVSNITIPDTAALRINGELTLSFQIIARELNRNGTILHKSQDDEYSLELTSVGDIVFTHGDGSSNESFNLLSGDELAIDIKTHIVVVRTATTIEAYKDGLLVNSYNYSLTPSTSTNDLIIGDSVDQSFIGELDELGIWSTALGSDSVLELYNGGKLRVYNSSTNSFKASNGYKKYSILLENGTSNELWTSLTENQKDRYLESENISLTQGGLIGEYYNGMSFGTLDTTRIDSIVDFDWADEPAGTNVGADDFSIRWTGYLIPDYTETYTLYVGSDDGTRLYINGSLLIDNWSDQAYNEESATIALEAGKYYHVEIEYYENGGGAEVDFHWESASQTYEIVPSTNLYYITIDSKTYNIYSNFTDWQNAKRRDLKTNKEKEILDVRGQWSNAFNGINLSGWTTDIENDYFVVIQAIGLAKPDYKRNSFTKPGYFRISETGSTNAIKVENLSAEIKNIQAESQANVVQVSTQSNDVVRILYSNLYNSSHLNSVVFADNNDGKLEIASSIIRDGLDGVKASVNNTGIVYIIDSTITECENGIVTNDTDIRPTSCAVFNNTDDFVGSFQENWPRFCASDDDDAGVEGIDISPSANEADDWNNAFADYANEDFRIKDDSSVLYDAGEPNAGGNYYTAKNIPYIDIGNAPRVRRDIGAFSFTDWWDYRYIERIEITVPASEVPTDLTDFPLYINISSINNLSSFWSKAEPDGSDIKVTNSEREQAPQELVFLDLNTKDGELWTKVNLSSTSDATFYVYYNFSSLSEEPDYPEPIPNNNIYGQYEVWTDYMAVWHLQDLDIIDATPNSHDGIVRGAPTVVTDGRFGYSIEWNETGSGDEESADVGNIQTDNTWTGITIESWFRKDTTGDERMICKSEGGTNVTDHIFALHSQNRGNFISTRISTDQTDAFTFDGDTTFSTGVWQFGAATWSSQDEVLRLFVNGQPDTSTSHVGNHIKTSSQQVEIANVNNTTTNRFWEGGLDEIRIAKKQFANPQERLEAQYNNQTSEAFSSPSPQPQTNPIYPPTQEVVAAGIWSGTATRTNTLDIDIDIPELTGKLALIIGVSNEDNNVSEVQSITLNGVNPTLAGLNTQGTGYSNTTEIWYFLNDELPSTPGTYTLTITMSESAVGIGATVALYDVILQTEAPVYSSNDDTNASSISTDATIDLNYVQSNIVFETLSLGDSETSTVSENQTELVDVEIGNSGARHASSFGNYTDSGLETITRTFDNTNRISQSVLVFRSGEEGNYTYKPFGGIAIRGDTLNNLEIDRNFSTQGQITTSGQAIYDYSVLIVYTPTGNIILSGEIEAILSINAIELSGGINLNGNAEYTIEFERIGSGQLVTSGNAEYTIEFERIGSGQLVISGIAEHTIEFEYAASGQLTISGKAEHTIEFERVGLGQLVTSGNAEYTIEFEYTANVISIKLTNTPITGILTVVHLPTGDDSLKISGAPDYYPEFIRTAIPTAITANGISQIDHLTIIPLVVVGRPMHTGGGDYYIEFARTMSGKITIGGEVPEFDFVLIIFPIIGLPLTYGGTTDENEILLPSTVESGTAIFNNILGEYTIEFSYEPNLVETPIVLGTTSATIIPNALFEYEGSGGIIISDSAETSYSEIKEYVASGKIYFRTIERPPNYSYYPIYEKDMTGGLLTLKGGMWHINIKAIEPSGGIIINAIGDIISDEIKWNYNYTTSGKIRVNKTKTDVTLHHIYNIIKRTIILSGQQNGKIYPIYSYTGNGIIIIRQASIHRYAPVGGITIFGTSEYSYLPSYSYTISGRIILKRIFAEKEYEITPKIYTRSILLSGAIDRNIIFVYSGSGKIYLIDPDRTIKYISPDRLIIRINGSATYYIDNKHYISSGYITTKGSAHYILFEENTYKSSGKIVIHGSSPTQLTYSYEYSPISYRLLASGAVLTKVFYFSQSFEYETSGGILTDGTADYEPLYNYSYISSGKILISGTSEVQLENNYIASGQIVISGIADLAYRYDITGGLNVSGSAEYVALPTFRYESSGKIKIIKVKALYYRDLDYTILIRKIKLSGTSTYKAIYNYENYSPTGLLTTSGSPNYSHSRIFEYDLLVTPITIGGQAIEEYVVERFYTGNGQVNINGTSQYEHHKIYAYTFSGGIETAGESNTTGRRDVAYVGSGVINGYGGSAHSIRTIIVRIVDGEFNPREPRRIPEEPKAARVFRYDLTR